MTSILGQLEASTMLFVAALYHKSILRSRPELELITRAVAGQWTNSPDFKVVFSSQWWPVWVTRNCWHELAEMRPI